MVSFDIPAAREICKGGGLLAQQGNTSEFAEKLDLLMSDRDLRTKLGNEAQVLSQQYELSAVLGQWAELFQKM